jgi:adenylosuccinate synthase
LRHHYHRFHQNRLFRLPTTPRVHVRVGEGPFPSECLDDIGKHLQTVSAQIAAPTLCAASLLNFGQVGREVGTTTGRGRRCGWLDLVVLKCVCSVDCALLPFHRQLQPSRHALCMYSTMINGYTRLNITKLDVLTGIPEIKVAVACASTSLTHFAQLLLRIK